MGNDKEILVKAVEKYASSVAGKFFGFKGFGTDMLIKIAVNNIVDKYGNVIDIFIDKNGCIPSEEDLFSAFKNVLNDRGGITVGNIKFTEEDIATIQKLYKEIKTKQINGGL